ncbi:Uncharacterized conserved coiled-coil protein [Ceraceosorus bombacis]|uniref:Uncharacterized conserved coiled-coil protein n=1 Tax=Ceraceosorus bombacis TaxID=401625 RepID=A0A0P1BJQ9_9BASI|nr:Uncharacterized conserved coiled-coil protein [Ceraceosorus bombacis]
MAQVAQSSALALDLPADLDLTLLQAQIQGVQPGTEATPDRLACPDGSLIITLYRALQHAAYTLNQERQEQAAEQRALTSEERLVTTQSELHKERERKNAETSSAALPQAGSSEAERRVQAVEEEKRNLLELLDREKLENARKAEELETLSARARETRAELSRLSSDLSSVRGSEGTLRFKTQTLEQQLELARNDASWAHGELTRANEAASAARTSTRNEIIQLQAALESATSAGSAAQTKLDTLQNAYNTNLQRLTEVTDKLADTTARAGSQEEAFRAESATQQRLISLLERRAEDADRRAKNVEDEWEDVLSRARDLEQVARDEAREEADARRRAESQVSELQEALDRLAEGVGINLDSDALRRESSAGPQGSERSFANSALGASFSSSFSPTAALASKVQRSGKSFSAVYSDLVRTQEELRRERAEVVRLGTVLEQVMADLEDRAPALQAQREEVQRLAADLEELAAEMAQAGQERDVAQRSAKLAKADAEAARREADVSAQQIADLGRQVRNLTREAIIRDDPAAATRLDDDGSDGSETIEGDTQAIITAELVTFSSLSGLLAQNQRLLHAIRELGSQKEAEEQKRALQAEQDESEAVAEARNLIMRLQEEMKSERQRAEAARRERDMFRSMCARTGSSLAIGAGATENGPVSATSTNLASQYAELQGQFDTFRDETAQDIERLKEDVHRAREEAGRASVETARQRAMREAGEERYRTLNQTYELARSELSELSKRNNAIQEQLTRREISSHSAETQLLEARSSLERLRNEAANLRAEKELHASTQQRVLEENRNLVSEKAALSDLLRNVQGMQNELERAGGEARRRLEASVSNLEDQTRDLREKLTKEEESSRQLKLQHEVQVRDLSLRLEKAATEGATAREHLAAAKSDASHLGTRVEDLTKQLQSKEERLAVFERRNAPSSSTSLLTREQQLEVEVADLRGSLSTVQVEAEQARDHVEQFKAIAEANEEALGALQKTYEEYKAQTEAELSQKESEINSRRQRLDSLLSELSSSQQESTTARQALETAQRTFAEEKRSLEAAMAELGGLEERVRAEQDDSRDEARKQAKLAREAHAKYEAELVAHADDIRALSAIKQQVETAQREAREAITMRETAEANLSASQSSWESQRSIIAKEKEELQVRMGSLQEQNTILHQHLESVSAQARQIRQAADQLPSATGISGDATSLAQGAQGELQEVINYLRREKEIVQLQVELRDQEIVRLRQGLEHSTAAHNTAQAQLAEERARASSDGSSSKHHEELLEKVNQLSILRESNATLRDEAERATRKAAQLESQLNARNAELEPLREQLRITQVELEAKEGQLRIIQEDNKRWQARAQSILQQYNRVDPEDIAKLEERAKAAEKAVEDEKEKARVSSSDAAEELQKQTQALDKAKADLTTAEEKFGRLKQQTQERLRTSDSQKREAQAEANQLRATASRVAAAEALEKANEEFKAQNEQLQTQLNSLEESSAVLRSEVESLQQRLEEGSKADPSPSDAVAQQASGQSTDEAVTKAIQEARVSWDAEKREFEAAKARSEEVHRELSAKHQESQTALETAQREFGEQAARLRAEWEANHLSEIEQAAAKRASQGQNASSAGAAKVDEAEEGEADAERGSPSAVASARVAELQAALDAANTRIAELQAELDALKSSLDGSGPDQKVIEDLKQAHSEALEQQESHLAQLYAKRQQQAIDVALKKRGQQSIPSDVQQTIEARVKEGVEQAEKQWQEQHKEVLEARYQAGKSEANLRNEVVVKLRDKKIATLTTQLAEAKGEPLPTTSSTQSSQAVASSAEAVTSSTVPAAMPASTAAVVTSAPVEAAESASSTASAASNGQAVAAPSASASVPVAPAAVRGRGGGPTRATTIIRGGRGGRGGANSAGSTTGKRAAEEGSNNGTLTSKRARPWTFMSAATSIS